MSKIVPPKKPTVANAPPFTPMRVTLNLSMPQQLVEAGEKIDTARLGSATKLGFEAEMYALTTTRQYGDFARCWLWSQNACSSVCGDQPSGFQFNMSPQAPVLYDPFSRRAMFNGIMALPLLDVPALAMRHFMDPQNRVSERMLAELRNDDDLGGPGDDMNFAGIYSTTMRDTASESTVFWLVTQSHSLAVADATMKLIEDAEPESPAHITRRAEELVDLTNAIRLDDYEQKYCSGGSSSSSSGDTGSRRRSTGVQPKAPFTTVGDLFFRDPSMAQMRDAQRLHRARVLAKLARAASIVSPRLHNGATSLDETARRILDSRELVDSTINTVDRVDKSDASSDVIYSSNMISVYDIGANGVLVRDAPRIGLDWLRGPWDKKRVTAEQAASDRPFISLPVSTGMKQSNALRIEEASASTASACSARLNSTTWLWTPPRSGDCHFWFDLENVRSRQADPRWLKHELAAGFREENGVQHLSNVCIRLASPEHKLDHIKRV